MRCLPVCLGREEARQRLGRRSWWRSFAAWGRAREAGQVDLVWVPHYLFTLEMESARAFGETTVSVDACSAAFAIFQMEEDLLESPPPEAEILPSLVPQEHAWETGRKKLLQAIMRRRGSQGPKPAPGKLLRSEMVLFPFWVEYTTRSGNQLDIRLLNAATGDRGGNQTKVGVLHAFVEQCKESQ